MEASEGGVVWEERPTGAVLEFLEGTGVGCRPSARVEIGPREGEDQESEGKEGGGAGPALDCIFFCPSLCLSFVTFIFSFVSRIRDGGDRGALI